MLDNPPAHSQRRDASSAALDIGREVGAKRLGQQQHVVRGLRLFLERRRAHLHELPTFVLKYCLCVAILVIGAVVVVCGGLNSLQTNMDGLYISLRKVAFLSAIVSNEDRLRTSNGQIKAPQRTTQKCLLDGA